MKQTQPDQIANALALLVNGRHAAKILGISPQHLTVVSRNAKLKQFYVNGLSIGFLRSEVETLATKRQGGQS